jgi:hypothetical protein
MKSRTLAVLLLATALAARAAEAPPPGPVVELPPLLVEESASLPSWLYARADGTEYLSRCREATTRGYIEMRHSRMAWVRAIFPAALLARTQVDGVTVLSSQRLRTAANAEVVAEVLQARDRKSAAEGFRRATAAPNLMLTDADIVGVFAHIDEGEFDRRKLTIASDYVRLLLVRRTPAPPAWLVEGLMAAYNAVLFEEPPVTLARLAWHSGEELRGLAKDTAAPRTLLPLAEVFSGTGAAARHPAIARAQAALLVRWALDPRNSARDGFARLAVRACEAPVTEDLLRETLGGGFADLRDRLSDYLPVALRETLRLELPAAPAAPALEIRRATPAEIARVRGEWERLAVEFVRRRHAGHATRYTEQARRTLRRAYDAGERDPRLVASLGLLEADYGREPAATDLIGEALALGATRPRVALEAARRSWNAMTKGQPAETRFAAARLADVLDPLRGALDRAPLLPEIVELWCDAWARCQTPPNAADAQRIDAGARQFIAQPRVCLRAARALGRHGHAAEAIGLLGAGFLHAHDESTRAQFAQMFSALQSSRGR